MLAADPSDTALVTTFIPILILGFLVGHFLRREWLSYQAVARARDEHCGHKPNEDSDEDQPNEAVRPHDPSQEPAYQFPGVPRGWSLDRYARDGISQMNLHLAQTARRRGDST